MNPRNFFAELKRRNVYKVAVAYAVVGWLLMQVAATVVPALHLSNAITSTVVVVVLLGFPLALVFAWAFEITPEGIKRTDEVAPHESISRTTGRKLDFVIIGVLLVIIGLMAVDRFRYRPAPASTVPEKSIAVLPFENRSEEKANAYFADGVQDEILGALAKVADLKVISRTSVMLYQSGNPRNLREIAQQLGVAHVVEGSVQRAGNKVRINAQLIDARHDAHLWAQTYDRDLADVFAIQSEIAKAIADQLQAKLSPNEKSAIERPPTSDVIAFDLYSRAKTLILSTSYSALGVPNVRQAVDLLNQALARDPSFFLAQCELVHAHDQLYFIGEHTPARLALADAAVAAAFRLRPDAGEAHLARAEHLYRGYLDYDGALAELAIARQTCRIRLVSSS